MVSGLLVLCLICAVLNGNDSSDLGLLQVDRDRLSMLVQTFKQLNTQYNRRTGTTGPPLAVHRVKVTFKDEPGEGSGVARSFYTAFAQVCSKPLVIRKNI